MGSDAGIEIARHLSQARSRINENTAAKLRHSDIVELTEIRTLPGLLVGQCTAIVGALEAIGRAGTHLFDGVVQYPELSRILEQCNLIAAATTR